jgi:hypothetical protein
MITSSAELTGNPKLDADGKNNRSASIFAFRVNVEILSLTDVKSIIVRFFPKRDDDLVFKRRYFAAKALYYEKNKTLLEIASSVSLSSVPSFPVRLSLSLYIFTPRAVVAIKEKDEREREDTPRRAFGGEEAR